MFEILKEIKEYIKHNKWTIREAADVFQVHYSTLHRILNKETTAPSLKIYLKLQRKMVQLREERYGISTRTKKAS